MVKSGDYFVFPGGGTQFKDGVDHYIESIEKVHQLLSMFRFDSLFLQIHYIKHHV